VKKLALIVLRLVFLASAATLGAAPTAVTAYSFSVHSVPKYKPGFDHFDYVNPDAPKGGTLRMGTVGTFDSFNLYTDRGDSAAGASNFYDALMTPSLDEVDAYYPLIAEKIEYASDYSWITFFINPKARFQDGSPITADDVVFTFNKLVTEGLPQVHLYYDGVTVAALDAQRAKFTLKKGDKAMLLSLAGTQVFPKKYWANHKLSEPLTEIPLGSGAYTVKDFKMGQYLVYQKVPGYWAANLPVNKGQLNFDAMRYDYYGDENVMFQAFVAGEFDFYQERISKNWATKYTGRNFDSGAIVKEQIPDETPHGMQGMAFNMQRPIFKDRRVRQALSYGLDFEWMNKNLFYGQYTRMRSYFTDTEYEAKELPGPDELRILNPLRDQIPPEVFTKEYRPPLTDGTGNIDPQIKIALGLLKDSGWVLQNQKLVNVKTGEPFTFEYLIWNDADQRAAIPIQKNLTRMGITMNIRLVDSSQYQSRLFKHDFDMTGVVYPGFFYPDTSVNEIFRSNYVDSTWNTPAIQDTAVDALVDQIVAHQEDDKALIPLGRAMDRVLAWNWYVIPEWTNNVYRVAYWNKFSRPAVKPKYDLGFGTWWFDAAKEAKLPRK
jgi:microcin C transport system substrate-binding protein